MCSIFGVLGKEIEPTALSQAAEAMAHRGPDGNGFYTEGNVALGMTRLAIIDTENGAQPFTTADGSIIAVCNGEIYNWREIRTELERAGVTFQTQCDVEIIPEGWRKWGISLFSRLNGMFSLAIYDKNAGEVILSRDPCGQKPLYYIQQEKSLYFSSEIKGLKALGCPLSLNQEALPEYLLFRYVSQPNTMFKEVKQLEGGQALHWNITSSTTTLQRWWTPPLGKTEKRLPSQSIAELTQLTQESVQKALQSDVPIGIFLSAGVDSAVLLNEICKTENRQTLKTYTAGFGAESDEVDHARELSEKYGVSHTKVELHASDLSSLPRVVKQMEVPVGDGLILAFDKLAQTARQHGVKVILGGEGPDELFLGYSFQKLLWLAEKIGRFPRALLTAGLKFLPATWIEATSTFPATLGKSGREKVARWMGGFSYAQEWWKGMGLRTVFEPVDLKSLLVSPPEKKFSPSLPEGNSLLERHYRQQFYDWLPDWAIIRQDRNTMAHSVEYRMPFLAPPLIEFSGKLPLDQKIRLRSVKWIWRKMAEDCLGAQLSSRPKQPFYFPLEEYATSAEYQSLLQTYLSEEKIQKSGIFKPEAVKHLIRQAHTGEFLPLKQVFSLLIFQIWFTEWITEEKSPSPSSPV